MEQAASSPMAIPRLTDPSGVAPVRPTKVPFRRNGVVRRRPPAYSAPVEARRTPMKTAQRLAVLALAIVAQTADGIATLQALEKHSPDILFLDINMPGLNGLEVARQASGRCHVVFVTAYDHHTLAAFEQGAADYLLKPVTTARLATTVARLKERIGRPAPALEGLLRELGARASGFLRWINASQGQTVRVITVDDVCYFQADSKYTRVVTPEGESLIRKPIKELSHE